jgi:Tol biopolymer transport system component
MLVGEAPFTGPSVQAIVARVMTEQPRGIALQRKSVPAGVEVAVMRALEKLPADRYSSAAEFVAALGAQVSAASIAPRAAERTRAYVVTAVTVAALCLAGGWLLGRRTTGDASAVAWNASIVLPDSLALEPLIVISEGTSTIALSPDGTQLAFVSRVGKSPRLFVRSMSDFSIRALDGTDGALAPFFSPSGDAVAFFAGTSLKQVTLADGRVTTVANVVDGWGGVWAPDGRMFVARRRASQLEEIGPGGDSLHAIGCPVGCSFPDLLPDGLHVIASDGSGLRVFDLQQGTSSALLRADAKSEDDRVRGMSARYDGDGHLVYVGPGGQLFAVPFDAKLAKVTGAPVQLIDGVRVETGRGAAQFALSRSGVLAYAPGPVTSVGILVRADRSGKLDTISAPPANYSTLELTPDGKRIVTRVLTGDGDATIQVVDALSGKVTPWISGASLTRPYWAADGRRVVFTRGGGSDRGAFIGDPELSAPPVRLRLSIDLVEPHPTSDSSSYWGWIGDTLVIVRTDGSPPHKIPSHTGVGAASSDDRWFLSEEFQPGATAIVARSLDGTGRRIVIASGGQFSMVGWVPGGHEFIMADAQTMRVRDAGQTVQGFFAANYDASSSDPIGAPRLLFRANVADFPGRNYGVGMGGNRFVFKQQVASPPPREIRMMSNWHQRLGEGTRR